MTLWEYRTVPVQWDEQDREWVGLVQKASPDRGTERLIGWERVLAAYGQAGWELVTVLPTGMLYAASLRHALAFFKRPKPEERR